jgi:methylsterol monooxygenase
MAFMNNYSTLFRWWDRLLGMDNKYWAYHSWICTATKGLDDVQCKAIEEKMVLEKEEAGFATENVTGT